MIENVMKRRFTDDWKVLSEIGVPFLDDGTETGDFNAEFSKVKVGPTFE